MFLACLIHRCFWFDLYASRCSWYLRVLLYVCRFDLVLVFQFGVKLFVDFCEFGSSPGFRFGPGWVRF